MSEDSVTEKTALHEPDTWHFFIYDVLYIAVLGAILYDLLKGPENNLRLWFIRWSLAITFVVDCLYTRQRLDSFYVKSLKWEDLLNAVIPLAFGYAFFRVAQEEFVTAFGVISGMVAFAFVMNLATRRRRNEPRLPWTLGLDAALLAMYLILAFHPQWFCSTWTALTAWVPTLCYAGYALWKGPNPRLTPARTQKSNPTLRHETQTSQNEVKSDSHSQTPTAS